MHYAIILLLFVKTPLLPSDLTVASAMFAIISLFLMVMGAICIIMAVSKGVQFFLKPAAVCFILSGNINMLLANTSKLNITNAFYMMLLSPSDFKFKPWNLHAKLFKSLGSFSQKLLGNFTKLQKNVNLE